MKKQVVWTDKFKYWFDNIMSKGIVSLVILLFAITLIVVIIAGVFAALIDGQPGLGIWSSMWVSLMHAIDAGTLAGDSGNTGFIILMSIVTVCGLFITSMLIGIINSGIESKMKSLRKGKSQVLESNHTIILGFREGEYTILSELVEANSNQKDAVIVVMDACEKEEMEDSIHRRITDTKTTRIICRSGQYTDFTDLEICSVDTCRSVIIQADNDFSTIKAVLAVTCLLKKHHNNQAHIAAVIQEEENLEAAQIAAEGFAEILFLKKTISRIMVHTCRQPGMSTVFTELFDYGGDEIYIEKVEGVAGKTMRDLCVLFPQSTVIGIKRENQPILNPPADTVIQDDDSLILIAEDDGVSVPLKTKATINKTMWADKAINREEVQKILILGCNEFLPGILNEADQYGSLSTFFTVAASEEELENGSLTELEGLHNIHVDMLECDIFDKEQLEKIVSKEAESILLLSNPNDNPDKADAKTLLLLLQLKEISEKHGYLYTVTSEMQRVENQELAQITGVNDFVISSNITNLMLAQISQTRELKEIFEELLVSEGSEIYMRSAVEYIKLSQPVSLYTVAAATAEKNEVFLGYRKKTDAEKGFEIYLNRDKNQEVVFEAHDSLIILAQE